MQYASSEGQAGRLPDYIQLDPSGRVVRRQKTNHKTERKYLERKCLRINL